jgi:hypothetical protein
VTNAVTRDESGGLVISLPFPLAIRVCGVLFLLPGLKILLDLLREPDGLLASRSVVGVAFEALGTPFGLAVALVFLVPGWILVTVRRHTTFDMRARELIEVRDVLVYRRTRRAPLATFRTLRLRRAPFTSGRTRLRFDVDLLGPGGAEVFVYSDGNAEEARQVALDLSAATGLRFEDRLDTTTAQSEIDEGELGSEVDELRVALARAEENDGRVRCHRRCCGAPASTGAARPADNPLT